MGENSGETGDKGTGEEEEGVTREGGEEVRVDCLSALVPLLSAHPSLHHMAHSGQLIQWLYYGGREVHSHLHFPFPVLHFPFPVCLIFAAFHPFPFSILCFAFLVSRFVRGSFWLRLPFIVSRFALLIPRFAFLVSH